MGEGRLRTPCLLPLWEKVPEGRMRGSLSVCWPLLTSFGSRDTKVSRTPHPALRATFSHKGRRQQAAYPVQKAKYHPCGFLDGR